MTRLAFGYWRLLSALCLFAALAWLPSASRADSAYSSIIPVGMQPQQELGPELDIYRDVSGEQTIADVENFPERFQRARSREYFGIHSGTLWVRLQLRNETSEATERWLVVDNCLQEHVVLYQPQADGSFTAVRNGARVPVATRSVPAAAIIFPVDLQPGETKSVYVAFHGRAVTVFNLKLWLPGRYLHRVQQEIAIESFTTGFNLLLLLVCGFAARGRRIWTLLLGGAGHFLLCCYSFVRAGYGLEWLQGGQGLWPQYTMQLLLALTWLCHALFARSFLGLPGRSRLASGVLLVMAGGFGLLALSSFLVFTPWLTGLTTLTALVVLTGLSWRYGDDAAKRGYLIWCLLVWISLLVTFAKGMGLLSLDSNVGLVGNLLVVVLASLVLTFSFYRNVLDVQQAAIAAQRRVVMLRRNEAARLRLAVRKKTHEIGVALDTAQRAADDKTQFLAMMAHELRAPLHVILGNLKLLQSELLLQGDTRLAAVTRNIGKLQRLFDHALAYGTGKMQAIKPELAVTNLPRMLAEVVDEVGLAFARNPALLKTDIRGELPLHVMADGPLLTQVLENLLANAVKYGGDGPIELQVEALAAAVPATRSIYGSISAKRIRFSVRDCGPGISPEDQERIFEPFTRLASSRHQPGQGLGLAVARQAVRAMGSELQLESNVGAGSRFSFDLILEVPPAPAAPSVDTLHEALQLPPAKLLAPLVSMLDLGEVLAMRALAVELRQQHPEWSDYLLAIENACMAVDLVRLERLLQTVK